MSTVVPASEKQMAMAALARLPETATLEQMSGELALLAAFKRGEAAGAGAEPPAEEAARRVEAARKLLAVLASWRAEDAEEGDEGDFDEFAQAMNASRAAVGAPPVYPPELKGKTW